MFLEDSKIPPTSSEAPLYSALAEDPDMLELIEMFVSELPSRARAIGEALTTGDLDALKTLAHQLKGSGGGYGFDPITASAGLLEGQVKTQADLATLQASANELIALCCRATAAVP
jgi:HPt (histidine-containing phosphotransfer) domain-containing protein